MGLIGDFIGGLSYEYRAREKARLKRQLNKIKEPPTPANQTIASLRTYRHRAEKFVEEEDYEGLRACARECLTAIQEFDVHNNLPRERRSQLLDVRDLLGEISYERKWEPTVKVLWHYNILEHLPLVLRSLDDLAASQNADAA